MLIALLPGDGIGPEVIAEARRVLEALSLPGLVFEEALVGGAAYKASGHPLPQATLDLAKRADAILFGAVGDPDCDALERHLRPEQAILGLRKELELFANLRPAKLFPELADASALRPEVASQIDMVIVRELNGDVYFGEKGMRQTADGKREGYDIMSYNEDEVRRIARVGFETAMARGKKLCSVDKANVLETSQLWRDVVIETAKEFPEIALSHMYVDNAAMQLVRNPGQFDVIVTGNLFGDILSDQASMCAGSIGMLPSASLDSEPKGALRTHPRQRPRHCRAGQGQSAGDDPVGGDDAALFAWATRSRRSHRGGGSLSARRWGTLAGSGRQPQHARNGRCRFGGPLIQTVVLSLSKHVQPTSALRQAQGCGFDLTESRYNPKSDP
jgi:3-isopropylmalate dehydrogenase